MDANKPLYPSKILFEPHWATTGVISIARYDYEGVDKLKANALMDHLRANFTTLPGKTFGSFTVSVADEFCYIDPIDWERFTQSGHSYPHDRWLPCCLRLSGTAGWRCNCAYVSGEKFQNDRRLLWRH